MGRVAWDWDEVDPPPRGGTALTVGAYLFASAVLFGGAVVAAVHRVEFNDTATSVVNGLHRYMTVPDAGGLRLALAAVIGFLVASAACSVLAVAAARNSFRGLRWVVLAATCVVIGLLVVLWFVAPPAFAPRNGSDAPSSRSASKREELTRLVGFFVDGRAECIVSAAAVGEMGTNTGPGRPNPSPHG